MLQTIRTFEYEFDGKRYAAELVGFKAYEEFVNSLTRQGGIIDVNTLKFKQEEVKDGSKSNS
ncbi:MAG: hypothetical protein KC496_00445 [Anaerolineae bacterium]|nr:hypothetical protein [Anaerolineae bacterium]